MVNSTDKNVLQEKAYRNRQHDDISNLFIPKKVKAL